MSTSIRDGSGSGKLVKVSSDQRMWGEVLREPISSERSRVGKLWGLGTGGITLTATMTLGSVLWFKNGTVDEDWYIQKLIFGWNGGTSSHNTSVFSLIFYNTSDPTANNTSIDAAIENISKSGASTALVKDNFTGYKWDGVSTGMTVGSGGFAQIPNRLAIGNTSIAIDGEIILGPGNSMEFRVSPEEAGLFHVSVVFFTVPAGKARGDE